MNEENTAETLAREMRKPQILELEGRPLMLVPQGFEAHIREDLLARPNRKKGKVRLDDVASFIEFIKREGSPTRCIIYTEADYQRGDLSFTAVLNDNEVEAAQWRDYRAVFEPPKSYEWLTWTGRNKRAMPQGEFAQFLEDNSKDIATVEGLPTGVQILEMAHNFEAKQEVNIKSVLHSQSGTVAFSYTDSEDASTTQKMEMYKTFAIGIKPFFNGQGYRLTARLKYVRSGSKVSFYYDLDRPDLTLQQAAQDMITAIKEGTRFPLLFGCP